MRGNVCIALLLALCLTMTARGQVLFEDSFQLVPRPEWQPLYGEWSVVDRRLVVLRNDYGGAAINLLNIPRPQNFAIEVEWDRGVGSDAIIVVLSYHNPSKYLRFVCGGSVGYGRETLPGKDAVDIDRRGCHIKSEGNIARVEVRGTEISANVNNSAAWQWKANLSGGKIGVGILGDVKIRRYRVLALGDGATPTAPTTTGASPATPTAAVPSPAPFAVDPQDVDALAKQLAEACLSESAPRRIRADAKVAIATFDLIDIPSPSTGKNVVEDLHTSMISAGFRLVERGQINRLLQELQVQSTTAINPATAQKLGQLLGAEYLLVGSVSDRGNFVVTNARLLEASTGKTVAAARVEMRKIPIQRE